MHGKNFSKRKWAHFLSSRAVPGSPVSFPEIEVLLCNVKSNKDSQLDREAEEKERQGRVKPSPRFLTFFVLNSIEHEIILLITF